MAAILILFFLLLANFILFRLTLPYHSSSRIGTIVRSLWAHQSNSKKNPSVLFLGSSRFHSCILPSVFNEYAQNNGIDVFFQNLAQPDMNYWVFSRIFTYVPPSSLNAKLIVIEVSPRTFNIKRRHPITKEVSLYPREFEQWASMEEILSVEPLGVKIEFLFKRLVPNQSLRDRLWTLKNIIKADAANPNLPAPEYHLDKEKEMKLRKDPVYFPENVSRHYMMKYRFSDSKKDSFLKFLVYLRNKGIQVIIVQPPVKESYFDYVRSDAKMTNEYKKHTAFLKQLSLDYVVINWQTPDMANLNESVFVDYGHFSLEGARKFSGLLLSRIKDEINNIDSPQTLKATILYRQCD
jgi:hypothetical protein